MKHVKKIRSDETPARTGRSRTKSDSEKLLKKAVINSARQMKQPAPIALPIIPGVAHLDKPERGSRPLVGPFYTDQIELLVSAAQAARDRSKPGMIFVAPTGEGFTIYRRASK